MAENLYLEEYKICHSFMRHLDEQNWNWGRFLFGGALAATGFVLSQKVSVARLGALSLVSTILLVGWLAYVKRTATLQDIVTARMHYLETYHLQALQLERLFQLGAEGRQLIFPDRPKPIRTFPFKNLQILEIMIAVYLGVLWLGTVMIRFKIPFT